MRLFGSFFGKSADKYLEKGDRLLSSERYFDARQCFEYGLHQCKPEQAEFVEIFKDRIVGANNSLAKLNISEAEYSLGIGNNIKAKDYLELAISLCNDEGLREKAELILRSIDDECYEISEKKSSATCVSCSQSTAASHSDLNHGETQLDCKEYFELLIRQLPDNEYRRYAGLGEEFAYAYIAASQDKHELALELLDKWFSGEDADVYACEKGKLLHRLGNDDAAEKNLRDSIQLNENSPLPWLALSQLFIEQSRFYDALPCLNYMVSHGHIVEQAKLLRGDVFESLNDTEAAIADYVSLLDSCVSKVSAEKLYSLLIGCNRLLDAEQISKKYLGKCCH